MCLQAILEDLEAKGLSVHMAGYSTWGPALSALLRRAKIVINLHHNDAKTLEDVPHHGVSELWRPGKFMHLAHQNLETMNSQQCSAFKVRQLKFASAGRECGECWRSSP